MAPKVHHARPAIVTPQWTMEHAIGDLGSEIRQPSNPFANLSERASLCCQINALTSILPELAPSKGPWPNGSMMATCFSEHENMVLVLCPSLLLLLWKSTSKVLANLFEMVTFVIVLSGGPDSEFQLGKSCDNPGRKGKRT